jgi:hypothetical protein
MNPYGVSWEKDGTILFGQREGIMRVSGNGGTPEAVIKTERAEQADGPQLLPGNWVLFTLTNKAGNTRWDEAQICSSVPGYPRAKGSVDRR